MSDGTHKPDRTRRAAQRHGVGFTLVEVLTALAILALASTSVLIVIDRCMASASDSTLRMEAFELARENLEKILALDSVAESIDFGTSEKYPSVSWQSVIEAFSEPVTGQMWVRAVCSAEYIDSKGEKQKIELVHWLTDLTDQQAGQLVNQQDLEKLEAEQVLRTEEEAVGYAKIDLDTLHQWVQDGLVRTPDGAFLRYNLDVFILNKGSPTPDQKAEQVESVQELARKRLMEQKELEQNGTIGGMPPGAAGKGTPAGSSNQDLQKTNADQVKNLVNRKQK